MSSQSHQLTPPPRGHDVAHVLKFVLITPARNEGAFIEETIKSVVNQTLRPLKWVIVSDGSTDATDEIAARYAAQHDWIELIRMPERRERHFAGKVGAFNAGQTRVADLEYDIIGNLDADITFEEDLFAFLITRFADNPRLGVAGIPFRDESVRYDYRFVSSEHVSGCCQLFRRECFEEIGGYRPNKSGGIDLVAVISSRMKGWQTRAFLEKHVTHHRKMGSAASYSGVKGAFSDGQRDYCFGCDPLWQLSRCIYRLVARPPLVLGGSLCFAGFFWAMVTRAEIVVPDDFVRFRRAEERRRLRELLKRLFSLQLLKRPSHD